MANALPRRLAASAATVRPHRARTVRRTAAGHAGTLAGWNPLRLPAGQLGMDRQTVLARAEDLAANDGHAASLIDTKALNIAGWGLAPQSRLRASDLGISQGDARVVSRQQERAFRLWCREAHAAGQMHFFDLQGLAIREALRCGEFIFLSRMLDDTPARRFSFALQEVHPSRLCTPPDWLDTGRMRDGIELDPDTGAPVRYHFQTPTDGFDMEQWTTVEAAKAHRRLVFHGFRSTRSEQWRGEPALAPVIKLFKDKYDFLDYEVIAQILTASVPVAIKSPAMNYVEGGSGKADPIRYQGVHPGQFLYLNQGEEAQLLQSNRPGNNFEGFFRLILRTIGSAAGVPYEQLLKDYSQTNYSSARAALLEFWRVCTEYRNWFVRHFCDKVWAMVMEEALLRGLWAIPGLSPAEGWTRFVDEMDLWTAVWWAPPPRGYVDPLKEMQANELALRLGVMSHSDIIGEQGRDAEEVFDQIAADRQDMADRGLVFALSGGTGTATDTPSRDADAPESLLAAIASKDTDTLSKVDAFKAFCRTPLGRAA